jgi:hypothetical protein
MAVPPALPPADGGGPQPGAAASADTADLLTPPGGPFRRGHDSRRARGRPRGVRNKATTILDTIASDGAAGVLSAMVAAAQRGDVQAAGLVLGRIWPAGRRPLPVDLPPLKSADDATEALARIAHGLAAGALTVAEAGQLSAVVRGFLAALEAGQLVRRIAELERLAGVEGDDV